MNKDLELVKTYLKSRDNKIMRILVTNSIDQLKRVVYRVCQDDALTEDMIHDTYIKVIEKLNSFKGNASFTTWVCQIGINLTLTYLKAKKNNQKSYSHTAEAYHAEEKPNTTDIDDSVTFINEEIKKLPEDLKVTLTLNVLENYSIREISKMLNCKSSTVYWRLQKAREILSVKLGELL